jgi:hypothetical protein
MASVFVIPKARPRGHVIPLIQAVEAAPVAAGIPTLWLHTDTAAWVYAKAGWRTVEIVQRQGGKPPATLGTTVPYEMELPLPWNLPGGMFRSPG